MPRFFFIPQIAWISCVSFIITFSLTQFMCVLLLFKKKKKRNEKVKKKKKKLPPCITFPSAIVTDYHTPQCLNNIINCL